MRGVDRENHTPEPMPDIVKRPVLVVFKVDDVLRFLDAFERLLLGFVLTLQSHSQATKILIELRLFLRCQPAV